MDDLIRRQDALDEIRRFLGYLDEDMINRIHIGLNRLPSAGPKITLNDLLDLIDYNRESTAGRIQLVGPDDDWDAYDEIRTSSVILFHLGNVKVNEIEAVGNDVIRVGIDWSTAPPPSKENQL